METAKFSKKEAISFGWAKMKENFWFFFLLILIMWFFQFAPEITDRYFKENYPILAVIFKIIFSVISVIISIGFLKIVLEIHDNKQPRVSDLFSSYKLFFRYYFASMLYALAVFGGLLLLIVPGIILAIRCQFYGYLIVERKAGIISSLNKSFSMTKGNGMNLFLFMLLSMGIMLLGILALVVGIFAAFPTVFMATTFIYRFLSREAADIKTA